MKTNLRLNFSIIEQITKDIITYKDALEDIKFSVNKVNEIVEDENSGEAIDGLKGQFKGLTKDIDECYNELEELSSIFGGYTFDMQSIIKPKNKSRQL